MSASNTLGLDDDLDSVELLIAIERAFGVKISDQDVATVRTMGDLQDLLVSKLEGAGGKKCLTSMSFYRVRSALRAVVGEVDIRPDTPLSAIWNRSPKRLFAQAQLHCGLRLASLSATHLSGLGGLLCLAAFFSVPVLLVAQIDGWLILAIVGALTFTGLQLTQMDPLAFGSSLSTVGDLARRTMAQNYGALVGMGGRNDSADTWNALVEVASAFAEILPVEEIGRATVILQSQFDRSRARA